MDLWLAVQTQWRSGALGPVGLDYGVLFHLAENMEIHLGARNMKKIQALEIEMLSKAGGRRSEVGGRKSEVRGQRSEIGGQRSELK